MPYGPWSWVLTLSRATALSASRCQRMRLMATRLSTAVDVSPELQGRAAAWGKAMLLEKLTAASAAVPSSGARKGSGLRHFPCHAVGHGGRRSLVAALAQVSTP